MYIDRDFLKWWIPCRHRGFIKSGVTVRDPSHRQPRFEVTFLRVVWSLLRWEPRDGMARAYQIHRLSVTCNDHNIRNQCKRQFNTVYVF